MSIRMNSIQNKHEYIYIYIYFSKHLGNMLNSIMYIDYYFYRICSHLGDNSLCLSVKCWLDWVSSL